MENKAYNEWFRKWLKTYQDELDKHIHSNYLDIMRYRFGNGELSGHSIDETCKKYGLTEEKLNRIETEVFQKINHIISKGR